MANTVLVVKKKEKLRVCIDFRDLNTATPKDVYVMPIADMLIDDAAGNELLSLVDGFSGYNQILIDEEDVHKMAFRCPGAVGNELLSLVDGFSSYNQIMIDEEDVHKMSFRCPGTVGIFEWPVMSFGLKNARATYQRAMNAIFHDMIGHHVEVYIDDIIIKSKKAVNHVEHLRKTFQRMRAHCLKLNPLKCAFGVQAGNFLGFLVHMRGVKIDKNKARAVMEAKPPSNKKELQRFLG